MFLLLACTSTQEPPDTTESTPVEVELTPIVVDDAWVASLEGFWLGPADPTPDGEIPTFPMEFIPQEDGSMFSTTEAGDEGDHIDLHFRMDEAGGWTLYEKATLSGATQGYTTHPVDQTDATITWVSRDDPGFLSIAVTPASETLDIAVTLRGATHVVFDLDRRG